MAKGLAKLGIKTMIRQADATDYQAIELFDPFSGSREEDIKEGRVFVYIKEGIVCGFISMARAGLLGQPYVQYLAVKPTIRRNGIASSLLVFIEKKHTEQRLFISTESDNNSMKSLLSKRAYVPAGEISGANLNGTNELYYYKENP